MARTKASDMIQLTDLPGRPPMTLSEAIDRGLVELSESDHISRTRELPNGKPLVTKRFVAWQAMGERIGWEVGERLYRSRTRPSHQREWPCFKAR